MPAALHGIEASLLASDSLRRLRSAVRRVVWSRHQPLASVGAVLGLLDGPTGCDPAFCVVKSGHYLSGLVCYSGCWSSSGYRSSGLDFCSPFGFSWTGACGQVYVFACCSSWC